MIQHRHTIPRIVRSLASRRFPLCPRSSPATRFHSSPSPHSPPPSLSSLAGSLPTRNSLLTSVASASATHIESSLQNGILSTDDFYVNGIPNGKFTLTASSHTLESLFSLHRSTGISPFEAVKADLQNISQSIKSVIGSDHPVLSSIAKYFFEVNGKRIRPAIVLLLSRAMYSAGNSSTNSDPDSDSVLLPSQARLSEITEMIHTASLLHDDVIDDAATRRGVASVNQAFGNKFAILGGDFLLARASLALARLRNPDVVELMSTSLEHLVKGEIMQLRPNSSTEFPHLLSLYSTKTYYKTASLIANSCKSVAILGGHTPEVQEIAYEYGKSLGLAFQIIDDVLDMEGTMEKMGKNPLTDLKLGLATAPVLYATQSFPQLHSLIQRKFSQPGDIEQALSLVQQSGGLQRARELAQFWGENAVAAIMKLPPSRYQSALIRLVEYVLNRES